MNQEVVLQQTIRSLNAEITSLKEMILEMTTEHEREITSLTLEIQRLKITGPFPGSPTKKEEALAEELQELRNSVMETRAKSSSDSQKEISLLRFEIAELKNGIANKEAQNAELTLRNFELSRELHASQELVALQNKRLGEAHEVFESRFSAFFEEFQGKNRSALKEISRSMEMVVGLEDRIGQVSAEVGKCKGLLYGNEKAIEYLVTSLSLMADLPAVGKIDVRELVHNPDQIIGIVDAAASAWSEERSTLREKLRLTSQSLSDSLSVLRRPPVSRPVARVLNELGSVILDVHSQLEEDHAGTLRLLSSPMNSDDATLSIGDESD
jgi:gas vesicle protein